jgi:hypothetical protein
MTIQVVGAGLGRTGTTSLKAALERLLGEPCHHMAEVGGDEQQLAWFTAAGRGDLPDWHQVLDGYAAVVDWPAASFWPEIAAAFPDAPVLLSTRSDSETWWRSAGGTIFAGMQGERPDPDPFMDMWDAITASRFTSRWREHDPAIEAYERHNAQVRATVDPGRLFEHQPGDGWEPLCEMLGLPVPDEPYPRLNTTDDWVARVEAAAADAEDDAETT